MKYIFAIYDCAFWLIYSFIVNFIRINPTPRKNAIAVVSLLALLNITWSASFVLACVNGPKWLYMLNPIGKMMLIFIPAVVLWVIFNLRYTSPRCEMLCERYSSIPSNIKLVISVFVFAYIVASIYLAFGEVGFDHMRYVSGG